MDFFLTHVLIDAGKLALGTGIKCHILGIEQA